MRARNAVTGIILSEASLPAVGSTAGVSRLIRAQVTAQILFWLKTTAVW